MAQIMIRSVPLVGLYFVSKDHNKAGLINSFITHDTILISTISWITGEHYCYETRKLHEISEWLLFNDKDMWKDKLDQIGLGKDDPDVVR